MGAVDAARATNENARLAPTLKRVFATAGAILTIFTAGAQMQPSLEAWEGYAHELTPARVHVVQPPPLQIGSGLQAEEVLEAEVVDAEDAADAEGHAVTDADEHHSAASQGCPGEST